jgi:hypothetical protein
LIAMLRCCLLTAFAAFAAAPRTFEIPPVTTEVKVADEVIPLTISGSVSEVSAVGGATLFQLRLNSGLTGLQDHITGLLRSQLNQSNRCGERLSVEQATLAPSAPAALLTASVHFEKWACAKAFGKELVKKLVAGNGVVQVRLTPVVEQNRTVKLDSEVTSIQADGPVGEALRSGSVGDALREKIRTALASAVQKGMNLSATLPPGLESKASVESVRFFDAGGGRLSSDVLGQVRLSDAQVQSFIGQLQKSSN